MARRRNPDDVLAARGYNARVLWPQYTPGGGVNSGSEPSLRPSNTLQSNQSNLILTRNPRDSAAYARRNSRNGSSGYSDYVELRPVTGSTTPYYRRNPYAPEEQLLREYEEEFAAEQALEIEEKKKRAKLQRLARSGEGPTKSREKPFNTPMSHRAWEAMVGDPAYGELNRLKRRREEAERIALEAEERRTVGPYDAAWNKPRTLATRTVEPSWTKVRASTPKIRVRTADGKIRMVSQEEYDLASGRDPRSRNNPKREIGDSMQARRKSKSCSGALINPGDSITKTASGWERSDLL